MDVLDIEDTNPSQMLDEFVRGWRDSYCEYQRERGGENNEILCDQLFDTAGKFALATIDFLGKYVCKYPSVSYLGLKVSTKGARRAYSFNCLGYRVQIREDHGLSTPLGTVKPSVVRERRIWIGNQLLRRFVWATAYFQPTVIDVPECYWTYRCDAEGAQSIYSLYEKVESIQRKTRPS